MPRPLDPAKMKYAAKAYASGKTFQEVAAELGMNKESLRVALIRRGIEPRPRSGGHNRLPNPGGVAGSYLGGESEQSIGDRLGVSRTVVKRWLTEAGIERRSVQTASGLHSSTLDATTKLSKVSAAHAARRGNTNSEEHMVKVAREKERVQYGGRTSPGTDKLCEMLRLRDIEHLREKAVGRYNVDIALRATPVAVEVLGGNWHGSKPIHARRTPYILDRGWNIVFVWNAKRCEISAVAADYIVSFANEIGADPSPVSQYRVIRGDGKLCAVGQRDDDEFPLVPPSMSDIN